MRGPPLMVVVRPMRIEADESTSRDSHSSEDDDGGLCELQEMQFLSKRRPSAVPSLDVEKAAELAAAEMRIDDSAMASCSSSSDCSAVGHGGWHIAEGPEAAGTAKAAKHDGEGWHILEGPALPTKSTGLLVAATKGDQRNGPSFSARYPTKSLPVQILSTGMIRRLFARTLPPARA